MFDTEAEVSVKLFIDFANKKQNRHVEIYLTDNSSAPEKYVRKQIQKGMNEVIKLFFCSFFFFFFFFWFSVNSSQEEIDYICGESSQNQCLIKPIKIAQEPEKLTLQRYEMIINV